MRFLSLLKSSRPRSSRRRSSTSPSRASSIETLESRQLLALTVANLEATDVTPSTATIGADVSQSDGAESSVSIYWGDDDGGTEIRDWDHVASLGNLAPGQYTTALDSLQDGQTYYYRSFAFNFDDGQAWAPVTGTFSTVGPAKPDLGFDGTPFAGDASAFLAGSVDGNGTLESATIYYGTTDGGTNPETWQHAVDLAPADGGFTSLLTGLQPATDYTVRLAATNVGGTEWSIPESFTTAAAVAIRISEVMPANASTLPTRVRLNAEAPFAGPTNAHDWLEIQNTTAGEFDLSGYYLSDESAQPMKWRVPDGTLIPAHGTIVIYASKLNVVDPQLDEQGHLHANFALTRSGETVALTAPDGQLVHQLDANATAAVTDVSVGYFGDTFGPLAFATPGESNHPVVSTISTPNHRLSGVGGNGSLTVTAPIETLSDSSSVQLIYRRMFEEEQSVAMVDDGTGGDDTAGDGVYTAIIPGGTAQPGEMLRYYVSVTEDHQVATRLPRFLTPNASPEYFGTMIHDPAIDTAVPVLHRFLATPNQAETGTGTRASIYFDGELYDNVFIRIRGGTARSWPKKAYKIEFNDDYHFRFSDDLPRVDEFNLNTTYTDKSYMRAVLSYELYRDSGGVAPITFPMRVEQNGEFWSLSYFVEQPDRDYLRHNGLDPNGAMYKARHDRLNGLTGTAEGFFEKKTRHTEDTSDLQALIDGLTLTGDELQNFLFDHVDVPAQVNLMAVNVILQNLDATDKNYYIYRDTEGNGEWKMLPWDLDLVMGPNALNTDAFSTSDDNAPAHTSHPYMGTLSYPFHGRKNHLFDAIVNSPRTNEMFLRRVRSLMDEFMASAETPLEQRYFENRINEIVAWLGPDTLLDKEKWQGNTHFSGQQYTIEEAAARIKEDYLVPRRVHLFETHNISRLETGEIKVLVPEFSNGEYFVPTNNDLGTTWTNLEPPANAEDWQSGQMGFGFEDRPSEFAELLNTYVKPLDACDTCTSFFVRVPFNLEDPESLEKLTLRMRYDDGFFAYINGVEVLRDRTRDENNFDSRGRPRADSLAAKFVNFDISEKIPEIGLGQENMLAIHMMNTSVGSNDMVLSLELVDGLVPDPTLVGIPHEQGATTVSFGTYDQNPTSGNQDEEFVEIVNTSDEAVDVSGWQLQGGVSHVIRGGTVIPAGESLYLTPDSLAFRNRATGPSGGMGLFVQDGYQGHLSNRGESLELLDDNGDRIAQLTTGNVTSDVQQFLRVTELHYNPPGDSDVSEFIELQNVSVSTTLDLNGVLITDGPSEPFDFSSGQITSLGPGEVALVVRDQAGFAAAYPNVDAAIIAGEFQGAFSNGGETIKIEDASNSTVLEFSYEDGRGEGEEGWHVTTDGDGYSLEIRNPLGDALTWDEGAGWQPSLATGGTPGSVPQPLDADYDDDGDVDADDIDALSAGIRANDPQFDLDQNGTADQEDRNLLISSVLGTVLGDSNLDRRFDSEDIVAAFIAGEYEDETVGNSGWAEGDWNGDGDFDSEDIVAAFVAGGYQVAAISGPRLAAATGDPRSSERLTDAVWADQQLRQQLIDTDNFAWLT